MLCTCKFVNLPCSLHRIDIYNENRDISNDCSLCVYVGVLLSCVMYVQFLYDVILHSFIINIDEMWFEVVSFSANHGQTDGR